MTSDLSDLENQIVVLAANQLGIDTYSISHGVGNNRKIFNHSKYIFTNFNIDQIVYQRSDIKKNRLVCVKNLLSPNEYRVKENIDFTFDLKAKNVLVLINPTMHESQFLQTTNVKMQINALNAIKKIVNLLHVQNINIWIKTHPSIRYCDINLIKFVNPELLKNVLPLDIPLSFAIENCDLVIALNYFGAAVLHASIKKAPILYYLTDHKLDKTGFYLVNDIYVKSGNVIKSENDLYKTIIKCFNDKNYLKKIKTEKW